MEVNAPRVGWPREGPGVVFFGAVIKEPSGLGTS